MMGVNAVLVDEESVGSISSLGCGAKVLHGDDASKNYLGIAEVGVC